MGANRYPEKFIPNCAKRGRHALGESLDHPFWHRTRNAHSVVFQSGQCPYTERGDERIAVEKPTVPADERGKLQAPDPEPLCDRQEAHEPAETLHPDMVQTGLHEKRGNHGPELDARWNSLNGRGTI
jgi:hypothetical protein